MESFPTNCMTSLKQKHVLVTDSCYIVSTTPVLSLSLKLIHWLPRTQILSHGARFEVTNKAVLTGQIRSFFNRPTGVYFLPSLTTIIMGRFNRVGKNVVHSGCPILMLRSPSPKLCTRPYCWDSLSQRILRVFETTKKIWQTDVATKASVYCFQATQLLPKAHTLKDY